jgi:hypothetical protein
MYTKEELKKLKETQKHKGSKSSNSTLKEV